MDEWSALFDEYHAGIVSRRRKQLQEAVGMTVFFYVTGGIAGLIGWVTPAGILCLLGSLGILGIIRASKGTLFGAILDVVMLIAVAGAAIAFWENLTRETGGIVVLVVGGLYALYLLSQLRAYSGFRSLTLPVGDFAGFRAPLVPDGAVFEFLAGKGQPAAIVLPPSQLSSLPAGSCWTCSERRCRPCLSDWTPGAERCSRCGEAQVLLLHKPAPPAEAAPPGTPGETWPCGHPKKADGTTRCWTCG